MTTRARVRDLGIQIGPLPTGPNNAITDVPGVLVGHTTLIYDHPRIARTGVTVIVPREGQIYQDNAFAAYHSFNGCGEMTGMHWVAESGLLGYPIAITNTAQVGTVHEAMIKYGRIHNPSDPSGLPVVAETLDSWLNDIDGMHVTQEHVFQALATAQGGPVAEGCVGGGTGMMCHDFKGGIGTASRVVETKNGRFTVGALVQANHGDRAEFRVNGVPVGQEITAAQLPLTWDDDPDSTTLGWPTSSIIVVIATDAPLLPIQCKRLAQRATVGIARVGGVGYNGSGDIFLAFATGNHLPSTQEQPYAVQMLPHSSLNRFFPAVADAVEESILNALTAAETTIGYKGHTAHALPLDELVGVMKKYGRL